MKPASFKYLAPTTLEECLAALEAYGEEAKILAGGQSLVPLMNMRLAKPAVLIDINRIESLSHINCEDGGVSIGALTRHAHIERSQLLKEKASLLPKAAKYIGHFQIRNRGTIGGSIAHADPTAEWPTVATALDARIVVTDSAGTVAEFSPEEFFLTYLTTILAPNQIITKIQFPVETGRTGTAFNELSRRHGDFAIVSVACQVTVDENDAISDLRLAIGGVQPVPYRAKTAEDVLKGSKLTEALLEEAVEAIKSEIEPESDIHATAEYRRAMAGEYAARTIKEAVANIGR